MIEADAGERGPQEVLGGDQAFIEHIDEPGQRHVAENLRGAVKVALVRGPEKGASAGELRHLDIADQVRRFLECLAEEIPWRLAAGAAAQRVAGIDTPEICINRYQTIQRMAEKTAIEDDRAGHRGPWIAQVMAGDGRNAEVRAQECRQIVAVQNRIVVRAVQGRKSVAELTLENGFDGTATVFKDVTKRVPGTSSVTFLAISPFNADSIEKLR